MRVSSAQIGAAKLFLPPDNRLTFSVTPRTLETKRPNKLSLADNLPLGLGTAIEFQQKGESAIWGFDSTIQIDNTGRKERVSRGDDLQVAAVGERSALIAVEIDDGIVLKLQGVSGVLRIDGADARPSLLEVLESKTVIHRWLAITCLAWTTICTFMAQFRSNIVDDEDLRRK